MKKLSELNKIPLDMMREFKAECANWSNDVLYLYVNNFKEDTKMRPWWSLYYLALDEQLNRINMNMSKKPKNGGS